MTSPKETGQQKAGSSAQSVAPEIEQRVVLGEQPRVRVGLLENFDKLDFRVNGGFSVTTLKGEPIFSKIESERRWRCKVETARLARYVYSILVVTLDSEKEAEKIAQKLRADNHPARVLPYGREIVIGDNVIHEGRQWRVIVGAFETEEKARPHLKNFNENSDFSPRVLRHRVEDPNGTIELYDSEYDLSAMVEMGFRLIPENENTEFTLYDVQVGVGFHWEHEEDRVYRGVIEVRVDNFGNLLALNELLLDEYLKGVVPSEMHYTYPYEALKAQAVAARSYTVAKLASRPTNDPIDFPATVHFQVYSGVTNENEVTSRAVTETAGQVLKVGKRVCETYFCSNSGGHTETKEYWMPPGENYLTGVPVYDEKKNGKFKLDLTREKDVEEWIRSHPENYSNPRGTGVDMLDRNARHFRWEITYPHRELEEIIKRKLGFDIGTLVDIQPLTRGDSGRIFELEILGTHKNHKVYGELNIRRVLSESALPSSCFIVELELGDLGHPLEITFVGAGFGHGVGMDQTASGVMATEGQTYDDILHFFYRGAELAKIW